MIGKRNQVAIPVFAKKNTANEANPKVWTPNKRRFAFIMSKLTNDQRLEIYHKRKQGMTISDLAKL
ncbi:MAG: hypothetical protein SOX68_04565, partial [Faecalicoccus sp.]|nr:hypothetical protein [Faecalicoccus sp.]